MPEHTTEEALRKAATDQIAPNYGYSYGTRRAWNLSQAVTATGIEATKLGRWLKGERRLTLSEACRLADYLGSPLVFKPTPNRRRAR